MNNSKPASVKYAIISIVTVIVIFGLLIIFSKSSNGTTTTKSTTSSDGTSAAPSAVTSALSSIQTATLDSIGVGTATSLPRPITAPALVANSKPEVLYEGAEYCPYCATERWSMAVALSQFGTFSNLKVTHSSSTDVYPSTQTLSFYKSTYTSQYLTFTPIEVYTNIANGSGGYTTLQTPTSAQQAVVSKYDATPYLPSSSAGSIPFIDFGGSYLLAGATYSPAVLQGKSATTIAAALSNPTSAIAKGADGVANSMIAAICKLTANQPSTVCDTEIQSIETSL